MIWPLLILGFCLVLLTQWITKHMQGIGYLITGDGRVALYLYFLLIFPGVLIHESSHALAAWLMGVKVRRMSLGIRRKGTGGQVSLGSVDIGSTGPIRASLIGLAPFVAGSIGILIIGGQVFNLQVPTPFTLPQLLQELRRAYNVPDLWLWVYLVFAISSAMLPSAADRHAWGTTLVFILVIGAVAYFSGALDGSPIARSASVTIGRWLWNAVDQLTYAFAIAVAVNFVVAAILLVIEQAMAIFGFGRLEFK